MRILFIILSLIIVEVISWIVCILIMNLYYIKLFNNTKKKISEQYQIEINKLIETIHNQLTMSKEVEQKLDKIIQFSEILNNSCKDEQINNKNSNNIDKNNNM